MGKLVKREGGEGGQGGEGGGRQGGELVVGEEGEGVVLDEDLLQVGALLEDGGRQGGEVVVRSRWASDQRLEREVGESTER